MNKKNRTEVIIIGSGILGLVLAYKLTQKGISVTVVEKETKPFTGASGNNVGMIHSGMYHSASIEDNEEALKAATNCKLGFEWYKKNAKISFEDNQLLVHTYVLFDDEALYNRAKGRADSIGIPYKDTSLMKFQSRNPQLNIKSVCSVLKVEDFSINQLKLAHLLVKKSKKIGTNFFYGASINTIKKNFIRMELDGDQYEIDTKYIIICAGPGIKSFYQQITKKQLPLRFWRDHLLVFPRMTQDNVFQIKKGQGMLFHHGSKSIYVQLRGEVLTKNLDNTVNKKQLTEVLNSAKNLLLDFDTLKYSSIGSSKIDLGSYGSRSVSEFVVPYADSIIFAAPGKMTAAPIVADKILKLLD